MTSFHPIARSKMTQFVQKVLNRTRRFYSLASVLFLVGVTGLFPISQTASAQCVSWINPNGGFWDEGNNWSEGLVPSPATNVCINLEGTYTILSSGSITLKSLVLGRSSGGTQTLQIAGSISVLEASTVDSTGVIQLLGGNLNTSDTLENFGLITTPNAITSFSNFRGQLINRGTININSPFSLNNSDGVILNEEDGIITMSGDGDIVISGGSGGIINRGRIVKTGGDETVQINSQLTNEGGYVDVETGMLRLRGVRLIDGTYNAAANAVLSFDFSTPPSFAQGRLSGNPEGLVIFEWGVFRANEAEAILDFGGQGFTWAGGNLMAEGDGTWSNEGIMRTIPSNNNRTLSGVTLANRGLFDIGAELIMGGSTSILVNEPEATIAITGDAGIASSGSIINRGLFLKDVSDSTSVIAPTLINEGGDVNVERGMLRLRGVRLIDGTYNAAANAVLSFNFSTPPGFAQGRLSGSPDGLVVFEWGTLNAFDGTATLAFDNAGFHWTGGNLLGDPVSFIDTGKWVNEGLLTISGSTGKGMNAQSFTNHGTIDVRSNFTMTSNRGTTLTLTNEADGVITIANDVEISSTNRLINRGLIQRENEDGTSTIRLDTRNEKRGVIAGSGTFTFLNMGENNGIISPGLSPGWLTWPGSLAMDSTTAAIVIEIGGTEPGTDYDRLEVTGTFTPAGSLNVDFINGFNPQDGDVFVPVTASGITGGFENLVGLTTANMSLYPVITETAVVLTARDGVSTVSGVQEVIPSSLNNGNITTFNITGIGFAPDATFRLECTSCNFPELSFPIDGRIRSLTSTNALVQFDLRDAFISGGYDMVIEDPRGGRVTAPVTISGTPGLTGLSVYASKPNASERGPEPGIISLRLSEPASSRILVNYELEGTATPFVHYVPSVPYIPANPSNFFFIPAGVTEFDVIITPLPNFDQHSGKTVEFKLLGSDNFEIAGQTQATISIENGPAPTEMDIFAASPNRAGNIGTIMMLVAGQGLTDGANARLTGGTSIDADFISVAPNGNVMNAMFDLSGTSPGDRFDLEVTDGNGKTAIIPNALLIEDLVEPEISVDLSGPTFFRGWLPPLRYYVTVTNRGNVDAMMVPLSIAVAKTDGGILEPEFDIIDLDPTQFDDMPDGFPGWGDNIALEDRGDRNVLSVIIPVVRAGETMVFTYLGRSRRHKAWTSPRGEPVIEDTRPIYNAVAVAPRKASVPTAEKTINMWMGISVEETVQMAMTSYKSGNTDLLPPDAVAAITSQEGQAITDCVASLALNLGLAVLPTSCLQSVAARATGFMAAVASVASGASDRTVVVSGASMITALVTTTMHCAGDLTPWGRALSVGMGLVAGVSDCIDIFGEDTSDGLNADEIGAIDPNDKLGPAGRTEMRYTAGIDAAGYLIRFENDTSATAPALLVHITDQIDTEKFDLSTFSLGPIGFGDILVTPPPGLKQWTTLIEVPDEDRFVVRANASLDMETGIATWQMMAIDPETQQYPIDPTAGFLPPNLNPPEGDGSVFFTIKPKDNLPSGTQLCNEASIVFDVEDPIITPPWCNVLDYDRPTSAMLDLSETQSDTSFTVSWTGSDPTSGVEEYLIFVSTNDGPFRLWKTSVEESGVFTGQPDSTYSFYTIARDFAGNFEQKTASAEATTTIHLATGIDELNQDVPERFALFQNYPNPFNPSTTIRYDVPVTAHVSISIYNVLGQRVAELVNREHQPGHHMVVWDGKNQFGIPVASGTYLYRIHSEDFTKVRKLMMIK